MDGKRLEFDLVLRSEMEIQASPAVVWRCLDRVTEWKRSVVSIERVRGTPGAAGEVLRLGQKPGNETVYVLMETLRLEPDSWKVQSLVTEDGRSTKGYLVYSLYARGSGTFVVGELLARACLPAAALAGQTAEQASRMICAATQAKLDADHQALKSLAESA